LISPNSIGPVCAGIEDEVLRISNDLTVTVDDDILKVAADSRSTAVAGAIAGATREQGKVDVRAIGASAVNQAVKAVAIARGYLK
jgi:hypothetical protein